MSPQERDPDEPGVRIRRILVALDASSRSLEALESAAELAARWKAELLGLFVEDADLLRLAAAASATRFLYPAASEEPLSSLRMEQELKALAEEARREMAHAAAHFQVRWSFRTVRGRLPAEILLAAAEADLLSLSLGGAGWPMGRRLPLGPAAHARPAFSTAPVLAIYDGSEGAEDAIRFAAQLAETYGNRLTVLVPSGANRLDPETESTVLRLLGGARLQVRFRAVDANDKVALLHAVQSEAGSVLVISGQSRLLGEASVETLMRGTDKPLLVVGGRLGRSSPPAE